MRNEAEFKSRFKRSVKYYRGYAASLSAPMMVGIPDLYIVMPTYIPVLLEAKWLGEIKREKFKRKLQFTGMQKHFLESCHAVSPYSAMGLIGLKYQGTYVSALIQVSVLSQFDENSFESCSFVPLDPDTKQFNIVKLFEGVPIPRIANFNEAPDRPHDPIRDQVSLAL